MALSNTLLKKLVQIPVFGGLTVMEATQFFEIALEKNETKGTVLFREGDEGDALIVVLDGEIEISKKGVHLAKLGAHSVLGEMSLLGNDDRRSATATALTDVMMLSLPSKRVQKLLKSDDLAALKVVLNIAGVLGKRLALINDKLVATHDKPRKKEELADFSKILNRWSF